MMFTLTTISILAAVPIAVLWFLDKQIEKIEKRKYEQSNLRKYFNQ